MTKRSWKIIGIFAGVIAIVALTLAIALPILIDPNRYHSAIVSEIRGAVGGEVRLGHIKWGVSNGIWVETDGLAITDAVAFPGSVTLSRVYVKLSIPPLLSNQIVLNDLILEGSEVRLRFVPVTQTTISDKESELPDQAATPESSDALRDVEIENFALSIARFHIIDARTLPGREVKKLFTDVTLSAEDLVPGRDIEFRIACRDDAPKGLGRVTANGSFRGLNKSLTLQHPELNLNADISLLHIDALKPYFPESPAAKGLGGDISLSVSYSGNLINRHHIDGRIDLNRFSYTDLERWEAPISGAGTVITFNVTIDPNAFAVKKLAIQRGTLSADASGVFQPWLRQPVLKETSISANLAALPELAPLIPWKQMGAEAAVFRKAMERGGKLAIEHASISDINLGKPPDSTKAWLSKIDATGEVTGFSVRPSPDLPDFEDITAGIAIQEGELTVTDALVKVGPKIVLKGKGTVINIGGGKPILKLAEFKSDFPLAALTTVMPWKQMEPHGAVVRQVIEGGGSVVVDRAVIRDINLADPPDSLEAFLPLFELAPKVSGLSVKPSKTMPAIEGLRGNINLRKSTLSVSEARGRIGPVSLPKLSIKVSNILKKPRLMITAKGAMKVAATRTEAVETLLKTYGLKSLSGSADMDFTANVDMATPKNWKANGTLALDGVRAESYPAAVVMDHLKGKVAVSRNQGTTVTVKDISARVNRSPVRLSGKFSRLEAPDLVIDAKAYAKDLDLANLRELVPTLRKMGLSGKITTDLDVYIPYAEPIKSRLNGMLAAQQVTLKTANYTVQKADAEFDLAGNMATAKRLTGNLNDQPLSITGRIINPAAPDIQLAVTSINLNLDRLVQTTPKEMEPPESSGRKGERVVKKSGLPPIAKKTTAKVTVKAKKGQYRGLPFQNLTLEAVYDRGVVKTYDLRFESGQGRVALAGSADLRKPNQIPFSVTPNVSAIPVEKLASVIGLTDSSVTGPVFLKGQLSGRAGTTKDLLASLNGNLDAQMGPGRFRKIGQSGELMAKILSLTSVQGLLSGALFRDFDKDGMTYKTITAQTAFSNGNLDVKSLVLKGDAMNMAAQGRIDMVNEQLNLAMNLGTLGLVGEVLKAIPIFGKPVDSMTEVHVSVKGSFAKPDIQMALLKQP